MKKHSDKQVQTLLNDMHKAFNMLAFLRTCEGKREQAENLLNQVKALPLEVLPPFGPYSHSVLPIDKDAIIDLYTKNLQGRRGWKFLSLKT